MIAKEGRSFRFVFINLTGKETRQDKTGDRYVMLPCKKKELQNIKTGTFTG